MEPVSRVPRKLSAEPLYEYALRALARRSHTRAELETKLAIRCADERDVSTVMERLVAHGYLNDERVAESHATFRRDYALVGRKRVLQELRRRGVSESTAEGSVAEAYRESDETELAREFLRRKLGSRFESDPISDRKELGRLFRALARAGFGVAAITGALAQVTGDSEWLESLEDLAGDDPAGS